MEPLAEAALLLEQLAWQTGGAVQDARLRSRLALVWGRLAMGARLAERFFEDPDPRVRANAIESLWGRDDEEAVARYGRALQEPYPRTVANACVGLYLAGRTEALRELKALSHHPESRFRAAGAWAMGRTGDPRFLPVLAEMRKASPAPVALLRAIVQARERILAVERLPRQNVDLSFSVQKTDFPLTVEVHAETPPAGCRVLPVGWGIEVNGATVWEFEAVPAEEHCGTAWVLNVLATPAAVVQQVVVTLHTGVCCGRAEKLLD
ncbi:MAG: HEAT repeat domain-containing protein [Bryobacteraceae bacterium]